MANQFVRSIPSSFKQARTSREQNHSALLWNTGYVFRVPRTPCRQQSFAFLSFRSNLGTSFPTRRKTAHELPNTPAYRLFEPIARSTTAGISWVASERKITMTGGAAKSVSRQSWMNSLELHTANKRSILP